MNNQNSDGFLSATLGFIGVACMMAFIVIFALDADPTVPQANVIPLKYAYMAGLTGLGCLVGCIATSKAKRTNTWSPALR